MIARRSVPSHYDQWNSAMRAPFGRPMRRLQRHLPVLAALLGGPFSFQPNSLTRTVEYPWAYFVAPIDPSLRVLEIGGGLSGFQFVLAREGCRVTNVDPMVDYGIGDYTAPSRLHAAMNRVLRTDVLLVPTTLDKAGLSAQSFDRAYCISTIEHLDERARRAVLAEARRLLKPNALFVLTVDLFLNLTPFTTRKSNAFGENVAITELIKEAGMDLEIGTRAELLGFPEFRHEAILAQLEDYFFGAYPALAQMFVLRAPESEPRREKCFRGK
jgi:SAM-dependent methyltransferase